MPTKPKVERTPVRDAGVNDAADELDLSEDTVRRDVRRGAPHSRKGTRILFNVPEYRQWREEQGLTGERGRPIEGDSPDLEAARLRKENALASKYELQVARERGQLVASDEVRAVGARLLTTFRNRLIGAGPALAPILEGRDAAERQTMIDEYNVELLTQLEADIRRMGERG